MENLCVTGGFAVKKWFAAPKAFTAEGSEFTERNIFYELLRFFLCSR